MWVIHAKLPPEAGAMVIKAIEAVANLVDEEDVSAETSRRALLAIAPEVDSTTAVTRWRGRIVIMEWWLRGCWGLLNDAQISFCALLRWGDWLRRPVITPWPVGC